jgi:hypothetical protein
MGRGLRSIKPHRRKFSARFCKFRSVGFSTELFRNAPEARRVFHLPEVVSTMWTESRYPNNAALMARPLLFVSAANAEAVASVGRVAYDRSSFSTSRSTSRSTRGSQLTSGGKVTPADGQEHPRTEL